MSELDLDYLITLIERHPVIWDTSDSDYKNKFIKHDAWKSVCESLYPNFHEKENNEKTELGNEVIKKWRGIKDTFNKYEKKIKEANRYGSAAKTIKEYHLYRQLLFLKKNDTTANINDTDIEQETRATPEKSQPCHQNVKCEKKASKRNMADDDIVKNLKEPSNRHVSFFKSILPSVKSFDDNKTLILQSRVLQILTELHQCPPHDTHSYYCPTYQSGCQSQHSVSSHETPQIRSGSSKGTEHTARTSFQPSPALNRQNVEKRHVGTAKLPEVKDVIARVYRYLFTEYENLKFFTDTSSDLSPLANILKRTAAATGVSEQTVSAILDERKRPADCRDTSTDKRAKLTHDYEDGDVSTITDEESNKSVHYVTDDAQLEDNVEQSDDIGKQKRLKNTSEAGEATKIVFHQQEQEECEVETLKMKVDIEDEVIYRPVFSYSTQTGDSEPDAVVQHISSSADVTVKSEPPTVKIEPIDDDNPQQEQEECEVETLKMKVDIEDEVIYRPGFSYSTQTGDSEPDAVVQHTSSSSSADVTVKSEPPAVKIEPIHDDNPHTEPCTRDTVCDTAPRHDKRESHIP